MIRLKGRNEIKPQEWCYVRSCEQQWTRDCKLQMQSELLSFLIQDQVRLYSIVIQHVLE